MKHYTTPNYCNPVLTEDYYMKYCPFGEKVHATILCAIVAFGAVTAIYTLISVYFGA